MTANAKRIILKTVIYIILFFVILSFLWQFLIGESFLESMKNLF